MKSKNEASAVFSETLQDFREWLIRLNYGVETIKSRYYQLRYFFAWLTDRGIRKLDEINREDLLAYNDHLHKRPVGAKTIEDYLCTLKRLNEYLENYGHPPVIRVKLRVEKEIQVERTILTVEEVNRLYEVCENSLYGMRDRVMLAVFYGCGLRSREGRNLELGDIDFSDGLLHVRKGKNYKERYVPMSGGVSKIIQAWIEDGHSWFSKNETNILLPNTKGKISDGSSLNNRIKLLCQIAEIDKHITLHCLRHSIATHLLQSGMDLENISRFLGHQGMEATKIYTRIINQLDG